MLLILIIIVAGSILGFYVAKKKNGNFLDKLQYISIFGIIFLFYKKIKKGHNGKQQRPNKKPDPPAPPI